MQAQPKLPSRRLATCALRLAAALFVVVVVAPQDALANPCPPGQQSDEMGGCVPCSLPCGPACAECNACTGQCINCTANTPCASWTLSGSDCASAWSPEGVACDDGYDTTSGDQCDGQGVCTGTNSSCPGGTTCAPMVPFGVECLSGVAPAGTSCDDDDIGTANDQCDGAGNCSGSAPLVCDPDNSCVSWYNDGTTCYASYADASTECDDGNPATQNDICNGGGVCAGEVPSNCDPDSACVSWYNDGTNCYANYAGAGTPCDDGNEASSNDSCNGGGTCAGELPPTCDPDTTCVSWSHDGSGCQPNYAPSGTPCDDGNLETSGDACNGGGLCTGSGTVTCDPDSACVSWYNVGTNCFANYAAPGTTCNDGDLATTGDSCNGGGVCAGSTIECPSDSTCTTWEPDGTTCVVSHAGVGTPCDDGDPTTLGEMCDGSGTCDGSTVLCPMDPNPCIRWQYANPSQPSAGDCVQVATESGLACNDSDPGTANDACDGEGGCAGSPIPCPADTACTTYEPNGSECPPTYAASGTACNDGSLATANDFCDGEGTCAGSPSPCPADTACTTYEPNGSECPATYAASGTGCNDGSLATSGDACNGEGTCAGSLIPCPADTACTTYEPNGFECPPTHADPGAACNDGSLATSGDACNGEGTCAGTNIPCPADTACTTYEPNGAECPATYADTGTACNDGSLATANDFCDGEGTCAGSPIPCPEDTACTTYTRDGITCVTAHKAAGTDCDDDDRCTEGDRCDGEGACGGMSVTCDSGEACGASGGCVDLHCETCASDDDCGVDGRCADLPEASTGAQARCLRTCDTTSDCDDEQTCAALPDGVHYCFDADGPCSAPPEEPGPDTDPVEPGPEPTPEADPDTAGPDLGADANTNDVMDDGGSQAQISTAKAGCGAGDSGQGLAGFVALALLGTALRRALHAA